MHSGERPGHWVVDRHGVADAGVRGLRHCRCGQVRSGGQTSMSQVDGKIVRATPSGGLDADQSGRVT